MLVGGDPGLAAGGRGVAAGLQLEPREAGRATASRPRKLAAPVPGAPWASATPPVPYPSPPPTNTVPPHPHPAHRPLELNSPSLMGSVGRAGWGRPLQARWWVLPTPLFPLPWADGGDRLHSMKKGW